MSKLVLWAALIGMQRRRGLVSTYSQTQRRKELKYHAQLALSPFAVPRLTELCSKYKAPRHDEADVRCSTAKNYPDWKRCLKLSDAEALCATPLPRLKSLLRTPLKHSASALRSAAIWSIYGALTALEHGAGDEDPLTICTLCLPSINQGTMRV